MTIEFSVNIARNLCEDNQVYVFSKCNSDKLLHVYGLNLLRIEFQEKSAKFNSILQLMKMGAHYPVLSKFVGIVGDSSDIDNNRISRHKKLWRRLSDHGLMSDKLEPLFEYMIEKENKIRFFGALNLNVDTISDFINISNSYQNSYIVANMNAEQVENLVKYGWPEFSPSTGADFIARIARDNGLLLVPFGSFDDAERGVRIFGKSKYIEEIYNKLLH